MIAVAVGGTHALDGVATPSTTITVATRGDLVRGGEYTAYYPSMVVVTGSYLRTGADTTPTTSRYVLSYGNSGPPLLEGYGLYIITGIATFDAEENLPIGTIEMYAGTTLPPDYLWCDGNGYSTTGTYANLYAAIGTNFGTIGAGYFNVPDFRSRSPIGVGTGAGFSTYAVGDTRGEETHQLTVLEMPEHYHTLGGGSIGFVGVAGSGSNALGAGPSNFSDNATTDYAGANGYHNTIHPVLACNFIIRYQ